jgi:hypothetical protein
MTTRTLIFPPIPQDTATAAGALFGAGNIYLRLGEHVNAIVSTLPQTGFESSDKKSRATRCMYAMLTAFQFAEELPDRQAVEAFRNRVDLKYALHLPLNYPSFTPQALCETRRLFFTNPPSQEMFQTLLDRLAAFGLLKKSEAHPVEITRVLEAICTGSRLEIIVEAMYQVLEALAATNPDWLRQVTLPLWYERYSRRTRIACWPNSHGYWKAIAINIGLDMHYLLGKVQQSGLTAISELEEVDNLRQILEENFILTTEKPTQANRVQWRPACCASCSRAVEPTEEVLWR